MSVHGSHICVQLPELLALKRYARHIVWPPKSTALNSGQQLSAIRGRGMDFCEVRNYQAGDDIRHMEWRVTARTGRPHIKIYQEERERPVILMVDFNPSMFFGTRLAFKSVVAARLATIIGWTVLKQGDRVGGFLYSQQEALEFMPRAREQGLLPLLSGLVTLSQQKPLNGHQRPMSEALIRLRRVTRPGSTIVIISDFYHIDKDCRRHLSLLRQHNNIIMYHIYDPIEFTPPKPAAYPVAFGEQSLLVNTRQHQVVAQWIARGEKHRQAVSDLCQGLGILPHSVTAMDDLPALVHKTFPGRHNG